MIYYRNISIYLGFLVPYINCALDFDKIWYILIQLSKYIDRFGCMSSPFSIVPRISIKNLIHFYRIIEKFWSISVSQAINFDRNIEIDRYDSIEISKTIDTIQYFLIEYWISIIESKWFRYDFGYRYCIEFSCDIDKFLAISIYLQ